MRKRLVLVSMNHSRSRQNWQESSLERVAKPARVPPSPPTTARATWFRNSLLEVHLPSQPDDDGRGGVPQAWADDL